MMSHAATFSHRPTSPVVPGLARRLNRPAVRPCQEATPLAARLAHVVRAFAMPMLLTAAAVAAISAIVLVLPAVGNIVSAGLEFIARPAPLATR